MAEGAAQHRRRGWLHRSRVVTAMVASLVGAAVVTASPVLEVLDQNLRRQSSIDERLSKANEQLAVEDVHVRAGAIYELGRIMHESSGEQPAILERLVYYVRERAPIAGDHDPNWTTCAVPYDVQAALYIIGRRDPNQDQDTRIDLSGADLCGADLRDLYLRGAYLRGTSLRNAALDGANFEEADLENADLRDASIRSAAFDLATLRWADLRGATVYWTSFKYSDLHNADLGDSHLVKVNFANANLAQAIVRHTHMQDVGMVGAHLSGSDLRSASRLWGVDLTVAWLPDSDLSGIDLSFTNMTGAVLTNSDLRGSRLVATNFSGAYLSGANLSGSDLTDAEFVNTYLDGADLSYVRGVAGSRLQCAFTDEDTVLPGTWAQSRIEGSCPTTRW